MAIRDYSEDDDYYEQGFHKEGVASVWVGVNGDEGEPDLDVLQDLCGVGYYRLSDQEHYNLGFELVDVRDLIQPLSYSKSYVDAAVAAAARRRLGKARWVTVQYDFDYEPAKVQRPIANDPVFIGSFPYSVQDSQQAKASIEAFFERRADGKEIHEGMDLLQLIQSGWEPLKITHVGWVCDGRLVGLDYADGVVAKMLPGRQHVALIEAVADNTEAKGNLVVLNALGEKQYAISRHQTIGGENFYGEFVWFERAAERPDQCFGAVFETNGPAGIEQYHFDIEIGTGKVSGIRLMR
jgi:hypothetical protein